VDGGGLAAVQTQTTGTVKLLASGSTISAVSRELFVLRRSGDGWRITDYMFNRTA